MREATSIGKTHEVDGRAIATISAQVRGAGGSPKKRTGTGLTEIGLGEHLEPDAECARDH